MAAVDVRPLLVVALLGLSCSACHYRAVLNFDCSWVPDPARRLDLGDAAHVDHALEDLRMADELAIRFGDRMAGWRLTETFGFVSRHGGVKDRDRGRQSQQECTTKLADTIALAHGVSVAELDALRPRLLKRGANLPVVVPVVVVLLSAIGVFTRKMRGRFEPTEWAGWIGATLLGSLVIPFVVLALGSAWAVVLELLRFGNEHLGHRARFEPFPASLPVLFGIGAAAVWVGSAVVFARRRSAGPQPETSGRVD